MRTALFVAAAMAASIGTADAQRAPLARPGARYPVPASADARPHGGWAEDRRPVRGMALPVEWLAPEHRVADWWAYGLGEPAPGYRWVRYREDAVLIDRRGSVYDVVPGIDWHRPRGDGGYAPPLTEPVPQPAWVSPDGRTTVVTTTGAYGTTTTTVVMQPAPVVTTTTTTTTTEYIDDGVRRTARHRR